MNAKEKFIEHLRRCSEIVKTWPKWKQVALTPFQVKVRKRHD